MDKYEITYLVTDEAVLENDPVVRAVGKVEGKVLSTKHWGQKNLAYPIKKHNAAFYSTVVAELEPEMLANLDRILQMDQKILRSLVVKGVYEPKVVADEATRRREHDKKFETAKPIVIKETKLESLVKPVVKPVIEPEAPKTEPAKVETKKEAVIGKKGPAKPVKKSESGLTDADRLAQLEGKLKELLKE